MMRDPDWEPLPKPEAAVVITLTRSPYVGQVSVRLTEEQIVGLDMDLDPHTLYTVVGNLVEVQDEGYGETPDCVETRNFVIPVAWLRPVESVRAWESRSDWERDLS